jgi:hypothetical protein
MVTFYHNNHRFDVDWSKTERKETVRYDKQLVSEVLEPPYPLSVHEFSVEEEGEPILYIIEIIESGYQVKARRKGKLVFSSDLVCRACGHLNHFSRRRCENDACKLILRMDVEWVIDLITYLEFTLLAIHMMLIGKMEYSKFAAHMRGRLILCVRHGAYEPEINSYFERTREMLSKHVKKNYEIPFELAAKHGMIGEFQEKLMEKKGIEPCQADEARAALVGVLESLKCIWAALCGWRENQVIDYLEGLFGPILIFLGLSVETNSLITVLEATKDKLREQAQLRGVPLESLR